MSEGWGEVPGKIIGYRAGGLDSPRGIFFSESYDGAWIYAHANGLAVEAFEISLESAKVMVAESQYAIYARRLGMSPQAFKESKTVQNDRHWLRKADAAIMKAALEAGYQAVVYTCPTTPIGGRELVVFDRKLCFSLGEYVPPEFPQP